VNGYRQTIDWLYQREADLGMDFRLQRLDPVLGALSHPENAFAAVHVAGTNGKGSTCAILHEIYTRGGYRVGMYTSPHLLSFRERIRVGRHLIDEAQVVVHNESIRCAMDEAGVSLTFFEIATVMAFLEFRRTDVDLAIVEVGMGGRLDATNLVSPVVSVITSVDHDHSEYLGGTLAAIAGEKSGILRPGVPLVSGPLSDEAETVVAATAQDLAVPRIRYGVEFGPLDGDGADGKVGLTGAHQGVNAAVAVAVVRTLAGVVPVDPVDLRAGLNSVRWPARFEVVGEQPTVVVDAAHNPHAVAALLTALDAFSPPRPWVLLFGVMADKDWREMLARLLPAFDHAVFVPVAQKRALAPERLLELAVGIKPSRTAASAVEGLATARAIAGREGSVVVAGSIFLASEIYTEAGGDGESFTHDRES